MEQPRTPTKPARDQGPVFYGPDDELPPGALRALERRTPEQLRTAADRATRRS